MPRIIKLEEVDSTNEWAKRNLSKLEDLDSVIAEVQTQGKGRNGKSWFSPKGGLWFSVILTNFNGGIGALSQLCAVSVCEILSKLGVNPKVKWPNDIILKGRKLGGILTEKIKDKFIIGIGLNINLSSSDFPIPLKDVVITMKELLHRDLDTKEIAKNIVISIAKFRNNFEEVYKRYVDLSEDIGRMVKIKDGQETFVGIVVKVQKDGGIRIKSEETEKVFYSGSIFYLD
ncbi:MAG: biotin--[acetyl-CoA-carboxylase] ligase [candidate division WOR-3 bacterium]